MAVRIKWRREQAPALRKRSFVYDKRNYRFKIYHLPLLQITIGQPRTSVPTTLSVGYRRHLYRRARLWNRIPRTDKSVAGRDATKPHKYNCTRGLLTTRCKTEDYRSPLRVATKKRPYGRSELRSPANIYNYSLRGLSPTPFTNKQNHNLVSHFFLTKKFFAYFFTKKYGACFLQKSTVPTFLKKQGWASTMLMQKSKHSFNLRSNSKVFCLLFYKKVR